MTILTISAKVSDRLCLNAIEGSVEVEYVGYVPEGINLGGEKYLEFDVDMETGQIQDWKPLTMAALVEAARK